MPRDLASDLRAIATAILPADDASLTIITPVFAQAGWQEGDGARAIDRLQSLLAEGPAWEAARRSVVIVSEDLATDLRWPRWTPLAMSAGTRAVLSVPLPEDGTLVGSLTLYSRTPRIYGDEDIRHTVWVAGCAAALWSASQGDLGDERTSAARTADRTAPGTVLEHPRLRPVRAEPLSRGQSRHRNIKLAELAAAQLR